MPTIIQPRSINLRKTLTVLSVVLFAIYYTYQRPAPLRIWTISGEVWSPYSVKFTDRAMKPSDVESLKIEVDDFLNKVNHLMSTYIPDSEISRFNQSTNTEPFPVAPEFAEVLTRSLEICRLTGGVFSPSLDKLINVWGFGHQGPRREPDEATLAEAMNLAGCETIEVLPGNMLRKTNPGAAVNVNALVEGWAVDGVARLLEAHAITNYFVEIGGEVFARGESEKMRPWRVGIDRPVDNAFPGETYDLVVEVNGFGLATSGSYRKFTTTESGEKVSHLLDPRTGRPATSPLASVTVLAPDTATADGLATALFVMGSEEGVVFVNQLAGVEAAFIEHAGNDQFVTTFSRGFEQHLLRDDTVSE